MLSIGTMAALCGTSVQTLRLYDKKGLLPAARIDPAATDTTRMVRSSFSRPSVFSSAQG